MISSTNGAGVTFSYGYNSAPRLTTVSSSLVDSQHPGTLVSGVHYGPFGPVSDILGNGVTEAIGYSVRGQLQSYSSVPYSFTFTSLAGNGMITAVADSVNGMWNYSYDQFNRLADANKSNAPIQGFSYTYDRYGNRWYQTLTQGTVGPQPQYLFDNMSNRISGSSVIYDALGNVTNDGLGNSFTYDAENRMIQAVNGSGASNYVYDVNGRRIRNGTYEFVYDLGGHATTLFNSVTGVWNYGEIYAGTRHLGTYSNATTSFVHSDWLGTKRLVSTLSGTSSQTCTSLPFGDGVNCIGPESGFNHFTDSIHDGESNSEHLWFRQLSGTQGRWLAPDPYLGSISIDNPQSLNRYAYVNGNPLNSTDILGLAPQSINCDIDMFGECEVPDGQGGATSCYADGIQTSCGSVPGLVNGGAAAICPYNICTGFIPMDQAPTGPNWVNPGKGDPDLQGCKVNIGKLSLEGDMVWCPGWGGMTFSWGGDTQFKTTHPDDDSVVFKHQQFRFIQPSISAMPSLTVEDARTLCTIAAVNATNGQGSSVGNPGASVDTGYGVYAHADYTPKLGDESVAGNAAAGIGGLFSMVSTAGTTYAACMDSLGH